MNRGASRRGPVRSTDVSKREAAQRSSGKRDTKGAIAARQGLSDRLGSYFAHHRASLKAAAARITSQPVHTLLTSLVVAIAIALPAILLIALLNLQSLGDSWDTKPKLSLYLHSRAQQPAIDVLLAALDNDLRVANVRYISASDALSEFEQLSGFGVVLAGLDNNPLPASIELELHADFMRPQLQRGLAEEFEALVVVDEVAVDLQWVQRFLSITELVRQIVLFLAGLLAFGALLAIGNTVRLIIENRKDEIIVIKLVGGTNGFVRRPLIYTGGLYGFIGGVLACLIVAIGLSMLGGAVGAIAESYQSDFRVHGFGFSSAMMLMLAGTILGWLGAEFAVGRHLSKIEPR